MTSGDAQKSEVHDATDDATSSPAFVDEAQKGQDKLRAPRGDVRVPDVTLAEADVVRDDTDIGGPLVLESDDPALNPPQTPKDPFPTDGTPEIDPPVEKR
jgi:hypothetical protein